MSEVRAKIICDSINAYDTRLTTIQVRVPKFLLQELNTHRVFSRSYNSARAIPAKLLRQSANFQPDEWLSNKPGMVGGAPLSGLKKFGAIAVWAGLTAVVKFGHYLLEKCGLHKQYTNRWLEPIVWADGVITSTDWDNFLHLRNHPAAQPEIGELAAQVDALLKNNEPSRLLPGQWHMPYIKASDYSSGYSMEQLRLISIGRCARVSYGFKDVKDSEGDLKRANMLLTSEPQHVSPSEHVALCPSLRNNPIKFKSGNFRNWIQYRQILESQV